MLSWFSSCDVKMCTQYTGWSATSLCYLLQNTSCAKWLSVYDTRISVLIGTNHKYNLSVISAECKEFKTIDFVYQFLQFMPFMLLTQWGRVTQICVSKLTIIGSDNGWSPGRRQVIIWTSAGILLIISLGTNFSEISIGIQTFSFKRMHFKTSSAK